MPSLGTAPRSTAVVQHSKTRTMFKGPSQDHLNRRVGNILQICQLNIEGISREKSEYLTHVLDEQKIDVLALQETHTVDDEDLLKRGRIPGFSIIAALHHRSYGIATYVRSGIQNVAIINCLEVQSTFSIVIKVADVTIANIYKPPKLPWPTPVLHPEEHPCVFIGDFNSHHHAWGYEENDENGDKLYEWLTSNNMNLIYNPKGRGTFHSARWKKDYSPDLCFVSNSSSNKPTNVTRKVLKDFPRSQHRPVVISIGNQIPLVQSVPKPRWNFKRANWKAFSETLDIISKRIQPTAAEYKRFQKAVHACAKRHIPRGYRKVYIPSWSADCEKLYRDFQQTGDPVTADNLMQLLNKNRKKNWEDTVENMDFTRSSRNAWNLLRKLGTDPVIERCQTAVSPDAIATRLLKISKVNGKDEWSHNIKNTLRIEASALQPNEDFSAPFTMTELEAAIKTLKRRKAAGYDGIYPEFIIHCGPGTRAYLLGLFNNILSSGHLPPELKRAKIIAIKKHGKSGDDPSHYRPISLLSIAYKLLERLLYNRIVGAVESILPKEQAGFRHKRSCCEQVVSLTNYIEDGFQRKVKNGAVFIDLTAAYDTVWRDGLLHKFIRVIPCRRMYRLMTDMLSNRRFRVHMGEADSRWRRTNNGLPQGSVLAPLLFNLYLHDIPDTTCRKFQYADDMALVCQRKTPTECEVILNNDLTILEKYFKKWKLQPNPDKTESCIFHLNNRGVNMHLQVEFCGKTIQHNSFPKYLGVTLDRSLTFQKHLTNVGQKLKTRVNLVQKLASTGWGACAQTLRTATLSLVYSTAEYCCPAWINSTHTKKVDVQLNRAMRIVTGTLQPTPTAWLPVLANIAPPPMRREECLKKEFRKYTTNDSLPIHTDLINPPHVRLRSRKPPRITAQKLLEEDVGVAARWAEHWNTSPPTNGHLVVNPADRVPGFNLPRREWCTLNRIRVDQSRCAYSMHRWGLKDSASCPCGSEEQTTTHIISDCHLTAFQGSLSDLHNLTPPALEWLCELPISL